ncbi:hypothetical protein D9M68_509500 [compost metagenome]
MGAHQLKRCRLPIALREQFDKTAAANILGDINPGFVGDPKSSNSPAPDDIGIVADPVTRHLNRPPPPAGD